MTVDQQQALQAAQEYLTMQGVLPRRTDPAAVLAVRVGVLRRGATWGVDHTGADWNEQAVRAAKEYMNLQAWSHAGLVQQLSSPYGGQFSLAQAEYGVSHAGL